jgi:hypothetical protein
MRWTFTRWQSWYSGYQRTWRVFFSFSALVREHHQETFSNSMATFAPQGLCSAKRAHHSPLAVLGSKNGPSRIGNRIEESALLGETLWLALYFNGWWVVILFYYQSRLCVGSWRSRDSNSVKANNQQPKTNAYRFLVPVQFSSLPISSKRTSF